MQLDDLNGIAEKHKSSRKKIIVRTCMTAGCMSSQADVIKKNLEAEARRKAWMRMSKFAASVVWDSAGKGHWSAWIKMASMGFGNLLSPKMRRESSAH